MRRKIRIPESPRYELARRRAYQLLCQQGVSRLPVDPWNIAASFPSISVCKWTELRKNCGIDDPFNIHAEGADAKTFIRRGTSDYLIVYDDCVGNYRRIRWTMSHELGHIVLGHLISFEATALSRGSLTERDYKVLEREADWFAANLLAPLTILNRIPSMKTAADFMDICELSGEAAENCMRELHQLKSGSKISFPIKEETILFRQFFHFISKINYDAASAFQYDDLIIDEKYDDYIECDYWDFIVWVIQKWEGETDLYRALRNSLALYDDEDMVIIVEDCKSRETAQKGSGIILHTLKKYADSCVRRIEIAVAVFR